MLLCVFVVLMMNPINFAQVKQKDYSSIVVIENVLYFKPLHLLNRITTEFCLRLLSFSVHNYIQTIHTLSYTITLYDDNYW